MPVSEKLNCVLGEGRQKAHLRIKEMGYLHSVGEETKLKGAGGLVTGCRRKSRIQAQVCRLQLPPFLLLPVRHTEVR